ncbi:hypothetical protein QQP08_025127 [Theobroma cacao]|nr:hypothetical protein QQP08_025127 [Theobroma cacao]
MWTITSEAATSAVDRGHRARYLLDDLQKLKLYSGSLEVFRSSKYESMVIFEGSLRQIGSHLGEFLVRDASLVEFSLESGLEMTRCD